MHQRRRRRVGPEQAVAGEANRRVDTAQCVPDHDPAVFAAEDQPDSRIVARLTIPIIQGRKVETHLAGVPGLERARLQIDRDRAA